jgi:hypothetical protein
MNALDVLMGQIDNELKVIAEDLAAGNAKNYEEYKHSCGVVRGLLIARNKVTELSERIEKSDE